MITSASGDVFLMADMRRTWWKLPAEYFLRCDLEIPIGQFIFVEDT